MSEKSNPQDDETNALKNNETNAENDVQNDDNQSNNILDNKNEDESKKDEHESDTLSVNKNIENDLTHSIKVTQSSDSKTKKENANEKSENEEILKNRGEINLLLLSETGVGKSTFINSIANYLTYNSFEIAEREKLRVLIPTKFLIEDKNGKRHTVSIGKSDKNEFLNQGESATQDVKSYIFPVGKNHPNIRLIDTPGMGDTRGPDQDIKNCDYILNYIGNLRELHGICCLFKPLNSRNTVYFQYCITEILSRLDKSASKNIVFVFTNTRGANYSSGETYEILKKTVDDIRSKTNVEISLDKNIFCFDNEAFRYLAATQKNVKLSAEYKEKCKESWTRSKTQFWRMLKYIKKIEPHLVQSTSAINEARRMVNQLAQPLADISELIHDNIDALQKHQEKLDIENMSLGDLRNQMFMPVIDLQVTTLNQPTTACTAMKCSEIYKIGDKNKWHYKQRCHEPCYLTNVQADTVDNPALMGCAAMTLPSNFCARCGCSYRVHMHVYYITTTIEHRIENSNALKNIDDKEKFLEEVNKLIAEMVTKKEELEKEHDTIVTSCAKFTHFLQNNAITPFNDSYKDYIEYLITREQALGPKMSNKQSVVHLRKLLQKYEETKKLFDDSLKVSKESGTGSGVTSKEIVETVEKLYGLKHSGKKIKELYESQQSSRKREHEYTEYIHSPGPKTYRDTKTKSNYAKKVGGYYTEYEKLYGSENKESLFRRIVGDFFGFIPWGAPNSKGKKQSDSRNGNTKIFRNVQKVHGGGFPGVGSDFYFGTHNPFLHSQPHGAFMPPAPEQYIQGAYGSGDSQNDGFYKWLFELYNSSNNPVNQYYPQNAPNLLQQLFALYNSSTAVGSNSIQNNGPDLHNGNANARYFNNYMANSDSQYHQQTRPQGRCYDEMERHRDSKKYDYKHTESSTYYRHDGYHNNPLNESHHSTKPPNVYDPLRGFNQNSNFNNERQQNYPQNGSHYSKVPSNPDDSPSGLSQMPNFNNGGQQNYPQNGNHYSKVPYHPNDSPRGFNQVPNGRQANYPQNGSQYSKLPYNLDDSSRGFPRDYFQASNFSNENYPPNESIYSKATERFNQYNSSKDHHQASKSINGKQHTYPYNYSKVLNQKDVTNPFNQSNPSRDHHQASSNPDINDQVKNNSLDSNYFGPTEDNLTSKMKNCQPNTQCSNAASSPADDATRKENKTQNKSHPNKMKKVINTKAKKVRNKKKSLRRRNSSDEWESLDEASNENKKDM